MYSKTGKVLCHCLGKIILIYDRDSGPWENCQVNNGQIPYNTWGMIDKHNDHINNDESDDNVQNKSNINNASNVSNRDSDASKIDRNNSNQDTFNSNKNIYNIRKAIRKKNIPNTKVFRVFLLPNLHIKQGSKEIGHMITILTYI